MPTTQHYQYGPFRIAVRCDDASLFTWLEEFIAPSFAPVAAGPSAWSLEIVRDLPRYEATLATGSAVAERTIETFTHDGHYKSHPLWSKSAEATTVWIDTHRCFATIDRGSRQIELLHGQPKARPRLAAMRILRELATIDRLERGHLHLHASAYVAADGTARLLTGPKRSGKSSSLIHALHDPAAQYLTNDRLYLHQEGGCWRATGMPTIVSVRPKSFQLFPRLGRAYLKHGYRPEHTLAESPTAKRWKPISLEEKASMTPGQFCNLLGVKAAGSAPLSALIFPRIFDDIPHSLLTPLPPSKAAEMLMKNIFRPGPDSGVAAAFGDAGQFALPSRDEQQELCQQLATQVPCLRLALGPLAYEQPHLGLPLREAA